MLANKGGLNVHVGVNWHRPTTNILQGVERVALLLREAVALHPTHHTL